MLHKITLALDKVDKLLSIPNAKMMKRNQPKCKA